MNRCSAIGVLLAVIGGGQFSAVAMADGERPIRLDLGRLDQRAPVSGAELQAALAVRAPVLTDATGDAVEVVVASPEPGQLEIAAEGRLRRVELGSATGADAARLLALIIVDVVRSGAEPFPAPARVMGAAAAAGPTPDAGGSRWGLAALVGLGVRTTDAGPGLSAGLEVRLAVGGRGRLLLSGGFERVEVGIDGAATGEGLVMTSVPVRAAAGLRFGWAEVRAGAVARPYWVTGSDADSGILWGGFVAGVAELPTRGPLAAFVVAGLDVLPQPVAFLVADQRILTFHTFAPFVAVGGVWRGRRG